MHALHFVITALLSGLVSGVLGYVLARSRNGAEYGRLKGDLKVAEEIAHQTRGQADDLREERDQLKERADRLEKGQVQQLTELRGQAEQVTRLDAELATVREKMSAATAEVDRLHATVAAERKDKETLGRDLQISERRVAELSALGEQHRQDLAECKEQVAALQAQEQTLREQIVAVEAARKELDQSREENNRLQVEQFQALAEQMLVASQEKLLTTADGKLSATTTAVGERLDRLDERLRQFDVQRATADTQLKEQITHLVKDIAEGREQTRSLVEALRRPQVRGAWGEMHLRRSVELAGMQEHCDFDTQVTVDGDDGQLRPDMVVHLTDGKHVVVDAKVSLAAFLAATEATDDAERERCWMEHAKQLRKHVDLLAGKEYFRRIAGSPDFVVMYLPGESLLQPALERDPQLLEYAVGKRVLIAGPTNLIMMLRTVAFAWTQAALQDNLRQVYELGRELYERLATMGGHLSALGGSLDRSVSAYNKAIGSLESRVLVTARRFQALKVVEGELKSPKSVEQSVRPMGGAELLASAEAERTVRALPAAEAEADTEIA
ncbi:DNA recombination protein RmuC [Actinoallomurus sp. NPDC052308]|uniref:DNA recombination protein RmuC n=1 Tax=Actinoallomurus sp. NPDC052308 TaxID=3155530 RepID=UPI003418A4FE